MDDRDLPWPPERPPRTKDVKDAWSVLFRETVAYLKRNIDRERAETRALLKILKPRALHARIVTERQHGEAALEALADDEDLRPLFDPDEWMEAETASYDMPDDEEHGDLATAGDNPYGADTRFCVALSLEFAESTGGTDPDKVEVTEHESHRVSVHPDAAAYLISRIENQAVRKTIADALVFKLIRDDGEQLANEEWMDGGVAPEWRDRGNDPAMDPLLICTHLRELYVSIVTNKWREDAEQ